MGDGFLLRLLVYILLDNKFVKSLVERDCIISRSSFLSTSLELAN